MTEVIAAILGGTQAGTLVLVAWLVYRLVNATDALADARIAQSTTEEHLAESQFRLAQVHQALDAANHAADVESQELANAPSPTANLPPGDVAGRLRVLLSQWQSDDTARADHASGSATALPASAASAAPGAGAR